MLTRFNLRSSTTGYLAFASVSLWFVLFKTLPAANQATNFLFSKVVNHPVQMVMDWSDIFALIVLWPAWSIWNQPLNCKNNDPAMFHWSLVSLLAWQHHLVNLALRLLRHIALKNEILFAFDAINSRVAISEDGGRTWGWPDEGARSAVPNEFKSLPISVCWSKRQEECYRITRQKILEESHDGGRSWDTSWQLPEDRLVFLKRLNPDINYVSYDLLIVEWESDFYLLVAAGEEGSLRRVLPDEEWYRIGVQDATPTPYRVVSVSNAASLIWRELLIWFFASIVTFSGACWIVWSADSGNSVRDLNKVNWILSPALSPVLGIFATLMIEIAIGFVFLTIR